MTYEQYWHDRAELFFAYQEAYLIKTKQKIEYDDQIAWLSGYYVLSALYEVMTLVNHDPNKVSQNDLPKYFNKPQRLFDNVSNKQKSENDIIEERTKKVEDDVKLAIANSMIALNKKKFQDKKVKG